MSKVLTEIEDLKAKIYIIRGLSVMLDRDLAKLYQVGTKVLNQAVKRNPHRFPKDFMFQLTQSEIENLRSQIVTTNVSAKSRTLPYVFTEQGVAMLSSVLNSEIAIDINIKIIRVFVELRQAIATQPEYIVLKEVVSRIESRMDTIEASHLVDHMVVSGKVTKLSKDVKEARDDIRHISELFDQFQTAHIVIKKPDEGINRG
jgi:hypothetical protein